MNTYIASLLLAFVTLVILYLVDWGMCLLTGIPHSPEGFYRTLLFFTFLTVCRLQIEKKDNDKG